MNQEMPKPSPTQMLHVKRLLPLLAVPVIVVGASLLCMAVNPRSIELGGFSLFALCIGLAFVIQWVMFVPAYLAHSERFFDLAGSATFVLVGTLAMAGRDELDPRSALVLTLVAIWAIRLGSFLARRIYSAGIDRRFNQIKQDLPLFLMTWTLQGMWVSFAFAAGLAAMTSVTTQPIGVYAMTGAVIWFAGFSLEVIADRQKLQFRANPENENCFITTGLWERSRHPNYFGEIVLWAGVAVIAFPVLEGWQLIALVSPLFIWLLLTRISGVRMLEGRSERRWGDDPAYREYLESTPKLVPRLF